MADDGQMISSKADDGPRVEEKIDFAVKPEIKTVAEESMELVEEGWEVPSARRTVRKKRTEGGRAFVTTKDAGAAPTLRVATT